MPVYRTKIAGRTKSVLIKAESAAKAKDQVVQVDALTADEMGDALASGEKVWAPGEPLPEDEKPTEGEDSGTK